MLGGETKREKEGIITHNKSDVLRNRTSPSSNIQDNEVLLNEREKKSNFFLMMTKDILKIFWLKKRLKFPISTINGVVFRIK